ncbi:MAG: amidohydrolase [Agriterribacter sp.]
MRLCYFILFLLFTASVAAQQVPPSVIQPIIEKEYPSLEQLYKDLHLHPELSFMEEKTSAKLATLLKENGNFTVTEKVGGFGVVAVMKNGEGPVVLIRTDMDALPVKEQTGAAFQSEVIVKNDKGESVPVMHACGHDLHMTVWTGVTRVLSQLKNKWKGTLVFIAQPAEERAGGAKAMLSDGLYTKFPLPDYALALHVNSNVQSGKVGYCGGYAMANIDMIDITVKGKGGHGAMPHQTKDPIVMAAKLIMELQTIVSREISPLDPAVITVGSIHGGSKGNIIPGEVKLELTVRSFKDEVQKKLIDRIKQTCEGVALSSGLETALYPVVTIRDEYTPAVYNDPILAEKIGTTFTALFGKDNVIKLPPEMYSEDFGRYGREKTPVPILMYSLGVVKEADMLASQKGERSLPSIHSSSFFPDTEKSIKTGILSMSSAILSLMNEKQSIKSK